MCTPNKSKGADRMSSFGDFMSFIRCMRYCYLKNISMRFPDGIVAPGYGPEEALEILKAKKKGNYNIVKIDLGISLNQSRKQVFGVTF